MGRIRNKMVYFIITKVRADKKELERAEGLLIFGEFFKDSFH